MSIETLSVGPLSRTDVLVRVRAASLCHTDLEAIEGALAVKLPAVLGHEAAGEIEAVGADVSGLSPGDHVVLSWNPHCGRCFYCDRAQPILCDRYLANGPRGFHFDGKPRLACDAIPVHQLMYLGGFSEYCVVPEQSAIRVPDAIPFDRAALIGCGVMTGVGAVTRIARPGWGDTAMVIGSGAVGLSAVQGSVLAGCHEIIAVDLNPGRLRFAQSMGATQAAGPADAMELARSLTDGRGADVVIEAAGTNASFRLATEAVRPGGQVVFLGKVAVNDEVSFRWGSLMQEKRIIRSSYGGAVPARDFPMLARAYLDGKLKLDEMISARIGLEQINEGFAALKRGETIRSVVMFP
jgi:S-(hydroxymethyl)glutathione dehydrogenase/alcohol dehydrogenase